MMKMTRGVLVDYQGYFLAALQWGSAGLPPNFNTPRRGQSRILPADRKHLLTEAAAIDNPPANGRWNFKSKVWELPTEKRWRVVQRRDIPKLWFCTGSLAVWPSRLPRIPNGQALIDTPPPDVGVGKRPVWDSDAGAWIAPRSVALIDAGGIITNVVTTYIPEDVPPCHACHDVSDLPEVADELDTPCVPTVGDRVHIGDEGVVRVERRRRTNHARVAVRHFRAALTAAGKVRDFMSFLSERGFTEADFDGITSISLNSPIVREFLQSQGITIKQAHKALIQAAQDAEAAETERRKKLTG